MFESIDIHSSVAAYAQIENHVRFAISSGRLKAGDLLPSVREVAQKLNINQNTVAKSYRDLELMGLVRTRRGLGVYVSDDTSASCSDDCRRRVIGRLHEVVSEAKSSGMSAQDVKQVTAKCLTSKAGPYEDIPASVLALAKVKK